MRREGDHPGGGERPGQPEEQHRHDRRPQPAKADPRAAVEEDHDERHDADPLDGPDLELAERREDVREHRRGQQEECGARQADTLADPAGQDRERKGRRDEEHDQPEGVHLVHSGDARRTVSKGFAGTAYSSLTLHSTTAHVSRRY